MQEFGTVYMVRASDTSIKPQKCRICCSNDKQYLLVESCAASSLSRMSNSSQSENVSRQLWKVPVSSLLSICSGDAPTSSSKAYSRKDAKRIFSIVAEFEDAANNNSAADGQKHGHSSTPDTSPTRWIEFRAADSKHRDLCIRELSLFASSPEHIELRRKLLQMVHDFTVECGEHSVEYKRVEVALAQAQKAGMSTEHDEALQLARSKVVAAQIYTHLLQAVESDDSNSEELATLISIAEHKRSELELKNDQRQFESLLERAKQRRLDNAIDDVHLALSMARIGDSTISIDESVSRLLCLHPQQRDDIRVREALCEAADAYKCMGANSMPTEFYAMSTHAHQRRFSSEVSKRLHQHLSGSRDKKVSGGVCRSHAGVQTDGTHEGDNSTSSADSDCSEHTPRSLSSFSVSRHSRTSSMSSAAAVSSTSRSESPVLHDDEGVSNELAQKAQQLQEHIRKVKQSQEEMKEKMEERLKLLQEAIQMHGRDSDNAIETAESHQSSATSMWIIALISTAFIIVLTATSVVSPNVLHDML